MAPTWREFNLSSRWCPTSPQLCTCRLLTVGTQCSLDGVLHTSRLPLPSLVVSMHSPLRYFTPVFRAKAKHAVHPVLTWLAKLGRLHRVHIQLTRLWWQYLHHDDHYLVFDDLHKYMDSCRFCSNAITRSSSDIHSLLFNRCPSCGHAMFSQPNK